MDRPDKGQHRPLPLFEPQPPRDIPLFLEKQSFDSQASSHCSNYAPYSPTFFTSSSREASSDYERQILRKPTRKKVTRSDSYTIPRSISRYLSMILTITLLGFIFNLFRMSRESTKRVEMAVKGNRPPLPAAWELFPPLNRYYGGIRTLVPRLENIPEFSKPANEESPAKIPTQTNKGDGFPSSTPYHPYPDYSSTEYLSEYAHVNECFLDAQGKTRIPKLQAYNGVPSGMPDPVVGSYNALGLRDDLCFDRFGRLGPYGFGYSIKQGGTGAGLHGDREGIDSIWNESKAVDFRGLDWGEIQSRCLADNSHRFEAKAKSTVDGFRKMKVGHSTDTPKESEPISGFPPNTTFEGSSAKKKKIPRTAVILRTWWDYIYKEDDILSIRALISELSLMSGGEYTVHLLVHVRDDNIPIWADEDTYKHALQTSVPQEFWGIATLWTERQMGLIYGGLSESFFFELPVHGVYRSTFMPVQYFAQQHPQYDFFWNWEMDIRYTGHFYHLFNQISQWAAKQPRKGLWERNERFYVPATHGSWEEFQHMARVQADMATEPLPKGFAHYGPPSKNPLAPTPPKISEPIWGPSPPPDDNLFTDDDCVPPAPNSPESSAWGVDEPADLITLNPLFDPDSTTWIPGHDVTGYNTKEDRLPRRAAIVTASRLSSRLLRAMHLETAYRRHSMFSEMWPGSVALHHGFKAVYAPHPVYVDRAWPPPHLAAVFNAGSRGAAGGARQSVFGDREHNFQGTTWFYSSAFAPSLWRRWLGYRVGEEGGEEHEVAREGRMCLPPMLLHPVKEVHGVVEGKGVREE
ncbi:MAG: hypothetical protein M1829_000120 [Trizodia sp. TS-e1964]|nr:MAG: hypothetical protein M1829_000120 [Trizodia sp. TS-e1964]